MFRGIVVCRKAEPKGEARRVGSGRARVTIWSSLSAFVGPLCGSCHAAGRGGAPRGGRRSGRQFELIDRPAGWSVPESGRPSRGLAMDRVGAGRETGAPSARPAPDSRRCRRRLDSWLLRIGAPAALRRRRPPCAARGPSKAKCAPGRQYRSGASGGWHRLESATGDERQFE